MKKEWANPRDFTAVFRCTNQKYAKRFIDYGEIKFNTPQSWVDYAQRNSEGRGDLLEGTLAFFHCFDVIALTELNNKYTKFVDIDRVRIGERVLLKRKNDMELPCFCFYTLKNEMFECPNEEGTHKIETLVPASYFRDFSDHMTKEEVDALPDDEKPAVIFIEDYQEFEKIIVEKLIKLGLDRNEIIITHVNYIDFNQHGENGWMDFNVKSPNQLTIKDKRFIDQNEARIIINTNKIDILKELTYPIRIGNLSGIAKAVNVYLHEGMKIEMEVAVEEQGN